MAMCECLYSETNYISCILFVICSFILPIILSFHLPLLLFFVVVFFILIFLKCIIFSSSSRQASRSPIPSRSLSPHSPQVGKTTPSDSSSSSIGESRGEPSSEDMDVKVREEETEEKEEAMDIRRRGEEAPPVLFQVSEAHLALYPDEDGDTYV